MLIYNLIGDDMIARDIYLNKLISLKDKNIIKVITGIRRCGKSTLFNLYIDYLKSINIKDSQIIKLNLEDPEYNFKDYLELYNYINKKLKDNKKYYIFLDEIQNIKNFEKAVDGLYIKENVDLYITGSNAYLLSGELATFLSGRYLEIKMLPLSFKEYASAFPNSTNKQELFLGYMQNGGMPGTIEFSDNEENLRDYLDGIFSTIVYKDIMIKNNITDKILLEGIIKFIFDSIGSSISIKKISDTLNSNHIAISNHTVENYINAFLESFLIYKIERYEIKGKKYLSRDFKYYVADSGLRYALLGSKANAQSGHVLENIVYLELLRRGYQVYIGKVDKYEIDFIAQNHEGIQYYQVALSVRDDDTLKRELRPLESTNDYYPKTILTLDNDLATDYNGIKKINVVDWLLEEK